MSFLCAWLLSEVGAAADAAAGTDVAAESAEQGGLTEVTVTAQRFKSTVQDTPISISALTAEQLDAAGLTSVEAIAHDVPGLSVRSAGPGLTEYEARGIASNGGAAPTVGFYLDDIPLSPPALSQSGKVVIDPNLYDINRVEVLRGPQGTLYGSGSMGGTVKIITNQPKLGRFEGSAQGTLSDTEGGSANGGGNLMLNIPLGEVLALRVVAGDQYRSGWINNVTLSPFPISPTSSSYTSSLTGAPVQSVIKDANDMKLWGERVSLLFQPSASISVLATFFEQHMALGGYDLLDGTPTSAAAYPVYHAHYEAFPLREGVHDDIKIYGLTATFDLGFADLTSATSYWDRLNWQTEDASASIYWTNAVGALSQGSNVYPPLVPIPYSEVDPSHQFSQELRLSSHDIAGWRWVAGAFFSRLYSVWQEESSNPALVSFGVPDGSYFTSYNPYTVKQTALFVDGSYAITSQWKLAAGVRWYSYDSNQHEYSWGYDGPSATPGPATVTKASDRGFNPRVNLSYEPSKDLNTYVTASKGFRPGGANQIIPPPDQPPHCTPGTLQFQPDSAWNFELGEKARFFNNWLTINGDVYYIKWDGVQQVFTLQCGYQFYNNAGNGRSFGPELEINAKLSAEWTLSLSGAWTDAKITQPSTGYQNYLSVQVTAPDGVTHPCPVTGSCTVPIMNVPRDTASAALIYSRNILQGYLFTARVDDSFVGSATDVAYYFGYKLPSYSIANARLILAHDAWSVHLFVDNITNKVALETANNTSFQFNIPQVVRYSTNQPRTFGAEINYRF
jgi:outer membrane receptor protein involved in Fe transport